MVRSDTRQALIQAGINAVLAGSFHGAGLQHILSEAGVPKGSFYHYFKSKEEFGVAIIEASIEQQLEWMRGLLLDKRKTPLKRLRSFFQACRSCVKKNCFRPECVAAKLGSELGQMSEPMRKAIKVGMAQKSALFAECIREGQEEGEIDTTYDASDLAHFIFSGLEGAKMRMGVDHQVKPIDTFVSIVLDRILAIQ